MSKKEAFKGFSTSNATAGCVSYVPRLASKWQLSKTKIPKGQYFEDFNDIPVWRSGNGEKKIPYRRTFKEAELPEKIMENINKAGYDDPTPVQQHCIPIILAGRDLMACGQTGTGKTAAFLLPMLASILNKEDYKNVSQKTIEPLAIIVSPTRELVIQICAEGNHYAEGTSVKVESIYGGINMGYQIRQCAGASIIVATPGRLCHLIAEGYVRLSECRFLVFDEADKIMEDGFEPQIRYICNSSSMKPKEQRQTSMFSATFPDPIKRLAEHFLNDYIFITVGAIGSANLDIHQVVIEVPQYEKEKSLLEVLQILKTDVFQEKKEGGTYEEKVLIFVGKRKTADHLNMRLKFHGYEVDRIHSERMQQERERAINDFKDGNTMILIANVVASRGLDIKGVDQVINYDFPDTIEEYVQRIGRTGRVGNPGRATSFFDKQSKDKELVKDLVKVLSDAQQKVPTWLQREAGQFTGSIKALHDSVGVALPGSAGRVFTGYGCVYVWD